MENTAVKKLTEIANKISAIRKNPIYIINLDEIGEDASIDCQRTLYKSNIQHLDVIIHSPGGSIESAYKIIRILRRHATDLTAIIPWYAKSAATLIALGMDELIFSELGELGPLDAQIMETEDEARFKSALNSAKAIEQTRKYTLETFDLAVKLILERSGMKMIDAVSLAVKLCSTVAEPLFSQINPIKLGEDARSLEVGLQYGLRVLVRLRGWSVEKAQKCLDRLVYQYPSHGFILDVAELKSTGLSAYYAEDELSEPINELKDVFIEHKIPRIIDFLIDPEAPAN